MMVVVITSTITNCTFEGNYINSTSANGGGIYIYQGTFNLNNSIFYNNSYNESSGTNSGDGSDIHKNKRNFKY